MRQPPSSAKKPRKATKEKPPVAPGSEHEAVGASGTELPLPHERDETPPDAAPRPDPVIRQAEKDIEDGQVDTDMRATPGLDAQRRERLVPGAGGRIKRRG